jgi:hypothetical protein
LAEITDILKLFEKLTIALQSKAKDATHGSVWEIFPAIELLLEHLEYQKVVYQDYDEPLNPSQVPDQPPAHDQPPANQPLIDDQPPAHSTRQRRQNHHPHLSPEPQPANRAQPQPRSRRDANDELNDANRRHIRTAINNAWDKLNIYYIKTDDTPVYLAALVLHPGQKWKYFELKWAGRPD